jgi:hypothetical protein
MTWILGLAFVFLVLIIFEWRDRSGVFRVLTLCLALGVFWFALPSPYRALRRAVTLPPVTQDLWNPTQKATEFRSGVFTMYEAIRHDSEMGAWERALSLGVLTWLALNPALRRRPGSDANAQAPASRAPEPTSEPSGLTRA